MTFKNVERPTWPQVFALVMLVGGGGAYGVKQFGGGVEDASREQSRVIDNAKVVEALARLQKGVESVDQRVQDLTAKVAVIEERQRRSR